MTTRSDDPPALGVYLCQGCGIDTHLDVDQLEKGVSKEPNVARVKQHPFLCSKGGLESIHSDLAAGTVNRVVLGACSKRAKTEAFMFDDTVLTRASLREGITWSQANDTNDETKQEAGADYLSMACVENRFTTLPSSSQQQSLNKTILVVGGGLSGLTAAYEAAMAGYSVTLIEAQDHLGGFAARLHRRQPYRSPYADPVATGVAELVSAVHDHPAIEVALSSRVVATSGAPGRFDVDIKNHHDALRSATFGAIIQTTGFRPYDANQLPEFNYQASPDVLTQMELEALAGASSEGILRPSNNQPVRSVVFIQCAGQRSTKEGHLSYCSGHCCGTSIKQAMYFKDLNPDIEAMILYTDLRTPGVAGEDFYRSGQEKGILFSKGTTDRVEVHEDGSLRIHYQDLILNESTSRVVDMVVLATGMIPNSGPNLDSNLDSVASHNDSDNHESPNTGNDIPTSVNVAFDSILNLSYRQGTDLPQLKHGFTDSNFLCFPYESRRSGIYAAGPVRRPMDLFQASEDATGAVMKAIQSIENAARGQSMQPRSGDLSFPSIRLDGCTQCKRCTVECPFGAIDEDQKGYPIVNESRCRRCGTCMGACPVRVISFSNYSIDSIGQQIKRISIPDEFEERPRILVLACENDAYPALDMAAMNRRHWSPYARIIPVRCLGSVNSIWIIDAINAGFDGVILMGCKSGDDYQCHFVKGSAIAQERMKKIADTLEQLGLENERVVTHEIAITDIDRAPALINDMAKTIEELGSKPAKIVIF